MNINKLKKQRQILKIIKTIIGGPSPNLDLPTVPVPVKLVIMSCPCSFIDSIYRYLLIIFKLINSYYLRTSYFSLFPPLRGDGNSG
jgi:hypothetical protein